MKVSDYPSSSFALDVGDGSYGEVQRYIAQGQLPPKESVQIEELVNHFKYSYAAPTDDRPVGIDIEIAACPWDETHRLARIGLRSMAGAEAHDVIVRVDFNEQKASAYRLIGYESRALRQSRLPAATAAGELAGGRTITALYEIIPAERFSIPAVREGSLLYASPQPQTLTVRLSCIAGEQPRRIETPGIDDGRSFAAASADFRFAAAVASFGMVLRDSPGRGAATLASIAQIAQGSVGEGAADRQEFLVLLEKSRSIRIN